MIGVFYQYIILQFDSAVKSPLRINSFDASIQPIKTNCRSVTIFQQIYAVAILYKLLACNVRNSITE